VLDVLLRLAVRPHAVVHRRNEQNGSGCCQEARAEQVVPPPSRGTRHEVRRSRGHDNHVGCFREPDVIECVTGFNQRGVNLAPGERLERDRADELRG
jgi:hypothetical protein